MDEASGARGASSKGDGLGDQLRDAASKAGDVAFNQAESTAEHLKTSGADEVRQVADTAQRVADDLQKQAPMLADYIRDAAGRIESMGDAMRERSVGDMLSAATEYGRKEPILLFAGAAVMGFALSRFVRSGLSPSASTGTVEDRAAVNKSTGIDV